MSFTLEKYLAYLFFYLARYVTMVFTSAFSQAIKRE